MESGGTKHVVLFFCLHLQPCCLTTASLLRPETRGIIAEDQIRNGDIQFLSVLDRDVARRLAFYTGVLLRFCENNRTAKAPSIRQSQRGELVAEP